MSELKINMSDYKASGVYFLEEDNSIITSATAAVERLAIGFNKKGPFNRPIYLSSTADVDELLGSIDRKLERKGCYTNRAVRTMIKKSPIYLMNLLAVDDSADKSGYSVISYDSSVDNTDSSMPYVNMFDRTKFWVADENTMVKNIASAEDASDLIHGPLFSFGNCGTEDLSVIIRKAEGLTGYNITAAEWYGSKDDIPYKWINPNDYIADYFVQVIVVKGKWDKDQYETLATDPLWKNYFDANGLKKGMVNKFLKLDSVTVVGNWTGCIIPDFIDKQGSTRSIDYYVNKVCNKTGLMYGINESALDSLELAYDGSTLKFRLDVDDEGTFNAPYKLDINTGCINSSTAPILNYMSYANVNATDIYYDISTATVDPNNPCVFKVDSSIVDNIHLGDYVRDVDGMMTKIIKKKYVDASTYEFTTLNKVKLTTGNTETYNVNDGDSDDNVLSAGSFVGNGEAPYMVIAGTAAGDSSIGHIELHHNISDVYTSLKFINLSGMTISNKHMPGYDAGGVSDIEAGVEKIYKMIDDSGINRGLLNKNEIDYRYVVDTMVGGLGAECKGKKYLSKLAMDKGHCTALINLPSMSDFAASVAPSFCNEETHLFDVKYIPDGGNQDANYTQPYEDFSLPSEDNGGKHAGFFTPYFKYREGNRLILVPPAADVSNTFMNKFTGGDPYKTVANLNGIITNSDIEGLEYNFDETDRGYLEPFGVNPIITRNGMTMIYGDRTAWQKLDSDYNFLHVRELLNTIEIKCDAVLQDYVFGYNIATTRAEIVTRLKPILDAMKDSGALVKYEIQVDENNNTKELIDNKFCIVDIGVWITQNMEKIVTRITLNRSTTA